MTSSCRSIAIAAVALGAAVGCSAAPPPDRPMLIALTNPVDMGVIGSQALVESRIKLQNVGGRLAIIERILPSCRCIAPPEEHIEVSPGETVEILIKLDTHKDAGPHEELIAVWWNAPDGLPIEIHLKAHIRDYMKVTPPSIHFDNHLQPLDEPRVMSIQSVDRTPFRIDSVEVPTFVNVMPWKKAIESREHILEFTLNHSLPFDRSRLDGNVRILTSSSRQSKLDIPAIRTLQNALLADPSNLMIKGNETIVSSHFGVSRYDGKEFSIKEVRTNDDSLVCECDAGHSRFHRVRCTTVGPVEHGSTATIYIDGLEASKGEVASVPVMFLD